MAEYGRSAYWDERYTKDPEPFDWYQRYSGLKDLINQYLKRHDQILMAGSGNSRLTEELYADGFKSIANVDISPVAIEQMKEKYDADKYKGISWHEMDMCKLVFPDEQYDAVVDKGTLDSILCGENSTANAAKMCKEVSRVLKPDGVYFVVSYGTPENRLSYLEQEDYSWNVTVHTIAKPTVSAQAVADSSDASAVHYIYVCQKK